MTAVRYEDLWPPGQAPKQHHSQHNNGESRLGCLEIVWQAIINFFASLFCCCQAATADSAKLMPRAPAKNGKYASCLDYSRQHRNFDMTQKGYYKTFLQQDRNDPFRRQVDKVVGKNNFNMGIDATNLDGGNIEVPGADAMEYHATRYFKKYDGMVIRIADNHQLTEVLNELNQKINSPLYVGVITTGGNLDQQVMAHVTPLLFYFPGNHRKLDIRKRETIPC